MRSHDWIAETEVLATFDREPMKGWKPSVATTRASSAMKSRIVGRQGDRLATYRASSSEPVHPGSNRKAPSKRGFSMEPTPGLEPGTPSLRAMVGTASIGSIRLRNTPPAPEFGLEAGLGRPELDTDLTRSTDSRRGAATFWLSSVSAIEALIADRDRRLSRTHALRHVGAVKETGIAPGRDVRISMPDELRHLDKSQAFRGIERYAAGRSRPSAPSRPRRTPSQSASASPWPCRRS